MALGFNRILGSKAQPEAARPHRVAIAGWPTMMTDPRTASLDALLGHVQHSGYEGVEWSVGVVSRFLPGQSDAVMARRLRQELEKHGLQCFGATLHINDEMMRAHRWIQKQIDDMKVIQDSGGEFASFQVGLHLDYYNTGGAYRDDCQYIAFCAERMAELRQATWDLGLNFYLEVHVDRITEDPAGLCRILDLCACELNGDLSHFLARGIIKGAHVKRILQHMQHTHVRLARMYGDLSAVVADPKADWDAKGPTWQLFQLMKPALAHGFTSRTIAGETGPMHLVKDSLSQDAQLVPYYRAMARFADAGAQGIAIQVDEPGQLKPWG